MRTKRLHESAHRCANAQRFL